MNISVFYPGLFKCLQKHYTGQKVIIKVLRRPSIGIENYPHPSHQNLSNRSENRRKLQNDSRDHQMGISGSTEPINAEHINGPKIIS